MPPELHSLDQISQDDPPLMQVLLPRTVKAGRNWPLYSLQASYEINDYFVPSQHDCSTGQVFPSLSGHALEAHVPSTASPSSKAEKRSRNY